MIGTTDPIEKMAPDRGHFFRTDLLDTFRLNCVFAENFASAKRRLWSAPGIIAIETNPSRLCGSNIAAKHAGFSSSIVELFRRDRWRVLIQFGQSVDEILQGTRRPGLLAKNQAQPFADLRRYCAGVSWVDLVKVVLHLR